MRIHLSRPDITEKEIERVTQVLRSPNLALGPVLVEFENPCRDRRGMRSAEQFTSFARTEAGRI